MKPIDAKFDRQGEVTGAGGLFLQTMPGAGEETISGLEDLVANFPSLGEEYSEDNDPEQLVYRVFRKYSPKFLANNRIEFMCHCNAARVRNLLTMLPIEDLKDILENGPFPVESRCHHCNTTYLFSQSDIQKIYGTRFPHN